MPNCERCGNKVRVFSLGADGFCDDCYNIEREKRERERAASDEYLDALDVERETGNHPASPGGRTPIDTNALWPLNFIKWCGYIFLFLLPFIGIFPDSGRLFATYLIAGIGCGLSGAFFHALSYIVTALGDIRDCLKNSD